eukprot:854689-Pelagomonas_calceolata.AAC.4
MESVLMEPPCGDGAQYDVRQLLALCTLGLVAVNAPVQAKFEGGAQFDVLQHLALYVPRPGAWLANRTPTRAAVFRIAWVSRLSPIGPRV